VGTLTYVPFPEFLYILKCGQCVLLFDLDFPRFPLIFPFVTDPRNVVGQFGIGRSIPSAVLSHQLNLSISLYYLRSRRTLADVGGFGTPDHHTFRMRLSTSKWKQIHSMRDHRTRQRLGAEIQRWPLLGPAGGGSLGGCYL